MDEDGPARVWRNPFADEIVLNQQEFEMAFEHKGKLVRSRDGSLLIRWVNGKYNVCASARARKKVQ